jgi:hypothetical protein
VDIVCKQTNNNPISHLVLMYLGLVPCDRTETCRRLAQMQLAGAGAAAQTDFLTTSIVADVVRVTPSRDLLLPALSRDIYVYPAMSPHYRQNKIALATAGGHPILIMQQQQQQQDGTPREMATTVVLHIVCVHRLE